MRLRDPKLTRYFVRFDRFGQSESVLFLLPLSLLSADVGLSFRTELDDDKRKDGGEQNLFRLYRNYGLIFKSIFLNSVQEH